MSWLQILSENDNLSPNLHVFEGHCLQLNIGFIPTGKRDDSSSSCLDTHELVCILFRNNQYMLKHLNDLVTEAMAVIKTLTSTYF